MNYPIRSLDSSYRKENLHLALLLLLFAVFYSSISLVNHYNFRSASLDLGIFNQTIHSFAHLEWGKLTLLFSRQEEVWMLGDHFSPMLLVVSPLYHVFGSYTLLVVQIVSLLWGAIGGYRLARQFGLSHPIALILTAQFLAIWATSSSLAFDFHASVPAAMCIPWLMLFYMRSEWKPFILTVVVCVFWKENMALWIPIIMIGLMIFSKKWAWRNWLRRELPIIAVCLIYFTIVLEWVMPSLAGTEENLQLNRYGGSLSELITWAFSSPVEAFHHLFVGDSPHNQMAKTELHFMVLVSGGFLMFRKPSILLMALPIYAQKMFSASQGMWGVSNHYSIEFVPLISLAVIAYISTLKRERSKLAVALSILATTALFHVTCINYRHTAWYGSKKVQQSPFMEEHYDPGIDRTAVVEGLDLIPEGVSVSASVNLGPHLANRKELYHFPVVKNSEYVAVITDGRSYYPNNRTHFEAHLQRLLEEGRYRVIYEEAEMLVLRRFPPKTHAQSTSDSQGILAWMVTE